jgi:hypothetical protein
MYEMHLFDVFYYKYSGKNAGKLDSYSAINYTFNNLILKLPIVIRSMV